MDNCQIIKVLVFGTFDVFHKGHESFLKQAKKYGDRLFVVIARDKTVLAVKKQLPRNDEKIRLKNIKDSKIADVVLLGHLGDKYKIIKEIQPDVICLGYDQKAYVDKLEAKLLSFGMKDVRIVRLEAYRPDVYKSSKL